MTQDLYISLLKRKSINSDLTCDRLFQTSVQTLLTRKDGQNLSPLGDDYVNGMIRHKLPKSHRSLFLKYSIKSHSVYVAPSSETLVTTLACLLSVRKDHN